jgi:hypothetical protein
MGKTNRITMVAAAIAMAVASVASVVGMSGCANYTYNGVRGEDLRRPSMKMVAGVGMAFVTHMAGHFAACQLMGKKARFEGLSEVVDGEMTDEQAAWFGRAGFLTANGIGWVAKAFGYEGEFWKGYNAGVMFETATYPLPMWRMIRGDGDDLKLIDRGGLGGGSGSGSLEWGLWSISSIGLNYESK